MHNENAYLIRIGTEGMTMPIGLLHIHHGQINRVDFVLEPCYHLVYATVPRFGDIVFMRVGAGNVLIWIIRSWPHHAARMFAIHLIDCLGIVAILSIQSDRL